MTDNNSSEIALELSKKQLYFVSSRERPWRHWERPRIHASRRILYASIQVFLFERVRKHTSCARWRHGHSWGETKYSDNRYVNSGWKNCGPRFYFGSWAWLFRNQQKMIHSIIFTVQCSILISGFLFNQIIFGISWFFFITNQNSISLNWNKPYIFLNEQLINKLVATFSYMWHDQVKWVTCRKCQFLFSYTTFS